MAVKVMIMGESGTGKSTSLRFLIPNLTGIVNPVNKPLPFRNQFKEEDMCNGVTDAKTIIDYMDFWVNEGKKIIVIDDFQYILSVPYMNRIKESGWDKWNDFGANYFEIIKHCDNLPNDVIVFFMTHTETLEDGTTTIKLIGKLLREKITIEGLFTIVLKTGVNEGKYYFYTQNSGKDTVKSPLGMFNSYAIENDLYFVDKKIRNYYNMEGALNDAEINKLDAEKAGEVEKPEPRTRKRTRGEVIKDNEEKVAEYVQKEAEAVEAAAEGNEEVVPFEEVKAPEAPKLEPVPRRSVEEATEEAPKRRTRKPRA